MEILLVRHGESEANAAGLLQGQQDSPLSARGREQCATLARFLSTMGYRPDVTYASPLQRAWQTTEILTGAIGGPPPRTEPLLMEIAAGALEGLDAQQIQERHPEFLRRRLGELGDFSEYGGESYDDVQARVEAFRGRLDAEHRAAEAKVLVVGHGGFHFHLLKRLVCDPVPRICIVKMGNCTACLLRLRDRRGSYLGEVVWHLPVELLGSLSGDGTAGLFR